MEQMAKANCVRNPKERRVSSLQADAVEGPPHEAVDVVEENGMDGTKDEACVERSEAKMDGPTIPAVGPHRCEGPKAKGAIPPLRGKIYRATAIHRCSSE